MYFYDTILEIAKGYDKAEVKYGGYSPREQTGRWKVCSTQYLNYALGAAGKTGRVAHVKRKEAFNAN